MYLIKIYRIFRYAAGAQCSNRRYRSRKGQWRASCAPSHY